MNIDFKKYGCSKKEQEIINSHHWILDSDSDDYLKFYDCGCGANLVFIGDSDFRFRNYYGDPCEKKCIYKHKESAYASFAKMQYDWRYVKRKFFSKKPARVLKSYLNNSPHKLVKEKDVDSHKWVKQTNNRFECDKCGILLSVYEPRDKFTNWQREMHIELDLKEKYSKEHCYVFLEGEGTRIKCKYSDSEWMVKEIIE